MGPSAPMSNLARKPVSTTQATAPPLGETARTAPGPRRGLTEGHGGLWQGIRFWTPTDDDRDSVGNIDNGWRFVGRSYEGDESRWEGSTIPARVEGIRCVGAGVSCVAGGTANTTDVRPSE